MNTIPGTVSDNQLDKRAFHVFECFGDHFLFDRATGATCSIDLVTYQFLSKEAEGSDQEDENLAEPLDNEISVALNALKTRGMFRFEPVSVSQQQELMESLWRHHPRRIQLLMAQGCNLGCRYCYAWRNGSNQKGTLMTFEVAKASIDHLVRNAGRRCELQVTFFGGEPLLNYDVLRDVVAYCRTLESTTNKRFTFELITNATLLSDEITNWIVSERFLLFISIDGWKEMHAYNRPSLAGDDLYDTILSNALYANAQYIAAGLPPLKVRANLTNRFPDSAKVGEYLASLGFKVIGVGAIEPLPHGQPSPSALTEDQMDKLLEKRAQDLRRYVDRLLHGEALTYFEGIQLKKSTMPAQPRHLKGITCGVARNTQVVDNKGNIFPCHRYEGMEAYIIGNVMAGGLDREKTMTYYRKVNGNATARCHSCWIRDYCAGGCAWLLSAKDGHLANPTERECDRRRKSFELGIWTRAKMRTHFPERFNSDGEIDLDSWTWGSADVVNDFADADAEAMASAGGEKASCGSECETCGPSGCAD